MKSPAYPRERVAAVLVAVNLPSIYRIVPSRYLTAPLGTTPADSRFCTETAGFTILYAASDFASAFTETVVRDRFMHKGRREITFTEVTEWAWALLGSAPGTTLKMLDLRRAGCVSLGAPTDTVNARNHAAGRALGKAVYADHADVDGLLYSSRLTGADIYAVFDRGIGKLECRDSGMLQNHPGLPNVLTQYGIDLVLER